MNPGCSRIKFAFKPLHPKRTNQVISINIHHLVRPKPCRWVSATVLAPTGHLRKSCLGIEK